MSTLMTAQQVRAIGNLVAVSLVTVPVVGGVDGFLWEGLTLKMPLSSSWGFVAFFYVLATFVTLGALVVLLRLLVAAVRA